MFEVLQKFVDLRELAAHARANLATARQDAPGHEQFVLLPLGEQEIFSAIVGAVEILAGDRFSARSPVCPFLWFRHVDLFVAGCQVNACEAKKPTTSLIFSAISSGLKFLATCLLASK